MPRQARNQHVVVSPHSSTRNNKSALPHDRPTRASSRNAARNSNTRVSQARTDGRISAGDRTAQHTAYDTAPTGGRLAELCSECECYLRAEEIEANERNITSAALRGRCDDCYRRSPAPIAPIGVPSQEVSRKGRGGGTGGGDGRREEASAGRLLSNGGVTGGADRKRDDRCRGRRGKRRSHGREREQVSPEGRAPQIQEGDRRDYWRGRAPVLPEGATVGEALLGERWYDRRGERSSYGRCERSSYQRGGRRWRRGRSKRCAETLRRAAYWGDGCWRSTIAVVTAPRASCLSDVPLVRFYFFRPEIALALTAKFSEAASGGGRILGGVLGSAVSSGDPAIGTCLRNTRV